MSTHKTAVINARIAPSLKTKAEQILNKTGLTSAEAIRLFYTQICLTGGLPFAIKIPNKTTLKALHDSETRKTNKAKDIDELFKEHD